MKRLFLALTVVAMLTGVSQALTNGVHRGKIINVYAAANGDIVFKITNLDGSTSTTHHNIWVPGTQSGSRNMLAVLLAAWQNGTTVTFSSVFVNNRDEAGDLWVTQ